MWSLTTRVPVGARFTYWLAENSPMVTKVPRSVRYSPRCRPIRLTLIGVSGRRGAQGLQVDGRVPGASLQPWIIKRASGPPVSWLGTRSRARA